MHRRFLPLQSYSTVRPRHVVDLSSIATRPSQDRPSRKDPKMPASSVPVPPATPSTGPRIPSLPTSSSPSPTMWEKIGTWVSDHKIVVYTVAGVAVVVSGAGVVYYLSDARTLKPAGQEKKRPSKKERRKAKQDRENEAGRGSDQPAARDTTRTPTVESDPLDDIPLIDETTVVGFSAEVRSKITTLLAADKTDD